MMISVIGAGPVGSYCAYLLARAGFDVCIFEEHDKVGLPVQCTGLVTERLFDFVPADKSFIVNRFDSVKVFSRKYSAEIPVREFLLDRQKFDNHLLGMAVKAGAKLYLSHRFVDYHKHSGFAMFRSNGEIKKFRTGMVIGADGPSSKVAKVAGLYDGRRFYIGMQAVVKGNFDRNCYQAFFGRCAPGFFAWIVPDSSKIARVGLATKNNTGHFFEELINGKDVVERQGGLIPVYDDKQAVQKDNFCLIGDAAGFCKSTTGGGLVSGLESAKILANCIINKKNYSLALRRLRRQLWLHNALRSVLDRFSESDYDLLVSMVSKPRVKHVLAHYDRDSPIKLLLKLLTSEPRFVYFIKCLVQKKKAF